jgi:ABC-type glutathione transport system ATPase component
MGAALALDDVSLELRTGEVFGIVGRSGAGKSTLVRSVNLLERPDAGSVTVMGRDLLALDEAGLRGRPPRHQYGFSALQPDLPFARVSRCATHLRDGRSPDGRCGWLEGRQNHANRAAVGC